MAEGLLCAPFLPVDDQGRKGGFASPHLPPKATFRRPGTVTLPFKHYSASTGRKTWSQPQDAPELGTRANQTDPAVLASHENRAESASVDGYCSSPQARMTATIEKERGDDSRGDLNVRVRPGRGSWQ